MPDLPVDPEPIVPNALAASFDEHRVALARFVRARLGPEASELDDMMQDIWLKVRNLATHQISDHRSYLFRLAHNLVLERHRAQSRARRRDAEWLSKTGVADTGTDLSGFERTVLARQRLTLAKSALAEVGARPAAIFRRFRLDGISQRQIATELGVSLSTVEKELRKAYDALAELKQRFDAE